MTAPYIGITGIVTGDDVETARQCAALVPPPYRFMAGVLVSWRTLRGEFAASRRYPSLEEARLCTFGLAEFCFPVVHYNTRALGYALFEELEQVCIRVPEARGIQLNIASPDPGAVCDFADSFPEIELILQVNNATARTWRSVPDCVAAYPCVRHALLDGSGGRGTALEPTKIAALLRDWRASAMPGVAGGLGPGCESTLRAIRQLAPNATFSVDAESRVRVPAANPTPNAKHQDVLDRDLALAYVTDCVAALRGAP